MILRMSSPASFEVLLAVSRELDDDFIDEDINDIEQGGREHSRSLSNRVITVRGKRHGQALVLSYQDYYSASFNPRSLPIYERNVLEVFAAQPKVSFEGRCKRRGLLDKLARMFGGGGITGPHPLFESLRLDAEGEPNLANFHQPGFPAALEQLTRRYDVERVLLQAGAGLSAVVHWSGQRSTAAEVLELVDQVRAVTATLD
jgi:hypothetical protein